MHFKASGKRGKAPSQKMADTRDPRGSSARQNAVLRSSPSPKSRMSHRNVKLPIGQHSAATSLRGQGST